MYSRLGPWDRCARQEDHGGDVYRPFVSGFDGIERRSLISSRFLRPVPTSLTHTTPTATSSPRPARRLLSSPLPPLCCSMTQTATIRHPTLLVAASHQRPPSQFLLGFFRAPAPGTRCLSCKQKSLSCSRYTSLRTAIHGKPPCHRVTGGF
ncbi:hypothetical protein B0H14DRAFT_1482584 [Mycena olivaceomarginata]|nr:hypothetical protein B0H14DRAFT_1482584 [Mycena olivaceomarginata]